MKYFLFCLLSILWLCAGAQTKSPLVELNMDLPDETEETDLLEKGEVQFESAYLHAAFSRGTQPSIVQALVRVGLWERFEGRFLIEEGHGRDRYLEETTQATSPMAASFKYAIIKDKKIIPELTLVGYLKLPFTSHSYEQSLYWSPIVSLAFQSKFGDKWKLEYNPGIMQEPFGVDWQSFFNASLHYKVTEQTEIFTEYYGQYQSGETPQHNAGLGVSYQLNNIFEFFGVAGTTVNYSPYNRFISVGFAVRI